MGGRYAITSSSEYVGQSQSILDWSLLDAFLGLVKDFAGMRFLSCLRSAAPDGMQRIVGRTKDKKKKKLNFISMLRLEGVCDWPRSSIISSTAGNLHRISILLELNDHLMAPVIDLCTTIGRGSHVGSPGRNLR